MGYMVELNTLLRPTHPFDFAKIEIGKKYMTLLERERAFPLRIALLLIDNGWRFYGYCRAESVVVKNGTSLITFEMLTLFTTEEQLLYQKRFIEAGKITGEVK